jgi:hypothetical protein
VQYLDEQLVKVARKLFLAVDSEVSRSCLQKLESSDLLGLVSMTINPSDYTNAYVFRKDYQCVNFLRKAIVDIPGVSRHKVALESFFKAEEECAVTNYRFRRFRTGPLDLPEARSLSVLEGARDWLKRVLGPIPKSIEPRFGPGSTFEDIGKLATIPDKMSSRPTITANARCLLPLWAGQTQAYRRRDRNFEGEPSSAWFHALLTVNSRTEPKTVSGNRFTTVPKDALKNRGICIEPSMNVYFQLGVGSALRARLRSNALIDLDVAADTHRELARSSSMTGELATIDLSNASDTVCLELVRFLLPPDWFELLYCLRSPSTLIGRKKTVWLEKFSSMGNGFTFELETLIFASICSACGAGISGRDFHVYGDDIIVKTEVARVVLAALRFCGFTPNPKKTFVAGKFRESCGGDFFDGLPVKGHFVKELPSEPQDWIALANGIRASAHEAQGHDFRWCGLRHAWLACLDALPSNIRRLRGPSYLGDLVIHDPEYQVYRVRNCIRYVACYKPKAVLLAWNHWSDEVMMASMLYSITGSGRDMLKKHNLTVNSRGVTPRKPKLSYYIGKVAIS